MMWILALTALAGPPRAALSTTATMPKMVLKPGDPVNIYLAMENRTDQVLWFEQHLTSPCWVDKYVDIEASPAITRKPIEGECSPPSAKVKPGETVSRVVNLKEVYDMPEQNYTYLTVKWKDGGPDIYSPLTQRIGPVVFKEPFFEGKMEKGGDFYLPNKTTAVWNGHESKPSPRRGESPALVLDFTLKIPGTGEQPRKVTINPDRSRQFQLEGYTFEMSNHQFDQWMEIRIFEP